MSLLPIGPDIERHCFAPCQPATFCMCLGQVIPCNPKDHVFREHVSGQKQCIHCGEFQPQPEDEIPW